MTLITENPERESRRRVLMIAAAFPPTGGPGVQRMVKFAKFLPRFAWQPHVWAVDGMGELPTDETLLDDLPDCVAVHRRKAGRALRVLHAASVRGASGGNGTGVSSSIAWRLRRWIAARSFPDAYGAWARSSMAPLARLTERVHFAAIISSFSPASNHLLAMDLAHRTGLPWIADFRDLWTDDYRYAEPNEARRRAHRLLQQRALERADRVIGVTPAQTALLAEHVPEHRDKFFTIRNGFDPADFELALRPHRDDPKRFVLGYVGRLDRRRLSEELLVGLAKLSEFLGDARCKFVFRVVGHVGASTRQALEKTDIPCEFVDYLPHARAIAEMRSATVLLVAVPMGTNSDTTIPAKPYEYMASGRPILHVGPESGQCAELVRTCDAGVAVGLDGERISRALIGFFQKWQRGDILQGCPSSRLAAFDRQQLTGRLADLLDAVATCGRRPLRETSRLDRVPTQAGAAW